mmetsp:Transcript_80564/g.152126  ORF Transcript_80564/g.152126 Transcript_80564/m.152126 type:complete len:170 (+) Transcript_80564:2-511(+)
MNIQEFVEATGSKVNLPEAKGQSSEEIAQSPPKEVKPGHNLQEIRMQEGSVCLKAADGSTTGQSRQRSSDRLTQNARRKYPGHVEEFRSASGETAIGIRTASRELSLEQSKLPQRRMPSCTAPQDSGSRPSSPARRRKGVARPCTPRQDFYRAFHARAGSAEFFQPCKS